MRWLLVAAVLCQGCALAPSGPSEFTYPPELQPVIALIDADPWIHPLIGESSGAWMRRHVRAIEMAPAAALNNALAHYGRQVVLWNPAITPATQGLEIMAAALLHEARHLQGYRHTCGTHDRTFEEGGAYAVQILWLEHRGLQAEANGFRAYIGC